MPAPAPLLDANKYQRHSLQRPFSFTNGVIPEAAFSQALGAQLGILFFLLISACFCVSLQHQLQSIVAIRQQHGLIWVTHYDCAHTTTNTILYQFSMKLLSACHNTQNILLNQTWTKAVIFFKFNFYSTDCLYFYSSHSTFIQDIISACLFYLILEYDKPFRIRYRFKLMFSSGKI